MKIAIAAGSNELTSSIDDHFGRSRWYCIFDTKTKKHEFIENAFKNHPEKAGYKAVDMLIKKRIKMVIAGRFGVKAMHAFRNKNIQMIVPQRKIKIKEIINLIK